MSKYIVYLANGDKFEIKADAIKYLEDEKHYEFIDKHYKGERKYTTISASIHKSASFVKVKEE